MGCSVYSMISHMHTHSQAHYIYATQATRVLCQLLHSVALHRIIPPLAPSMLSTLPFKHTHPQLMGVALEAVGELCVVVRAGMLEYVHKLVPLILSVLGDRQSLRNREVCLRTLGRLVTSTGWVVQPYLQFPQLLPTVSE